MLIWGGGLKPPTPVASSLGNYERLSVKQRNRSNNLINAVHQSIRQKTGHTGLVVSMSNCGVNLTADGCGYRDGYWDMQPRAWAVPYCSAYVNSALHPFGVVKLSTSFGWGKGGNVTSARWQVIPCDPTLHASSWSGNTRLLTKSKPLYRIYRNFTFYFTKTMEYSLNFMKSNEGPKTATYTAVNTWHQIKYNMTPDINSKDSVRM